ncbi:MAG: hypothetical protein ABIO70_33115 [Pseudomonadota bacterium]
MLALFALVATIALAAEPACPAAPETLRAEMQQALQDYEAMEADAFLGHVQQLVADAGCVTAPLSRSDAFQLYQLQSLYAFVNDDHEGMRASLRAMLAVRPEYVLPEDLAAPGSTMAEAYAAVKQAPPAASAPLQGGDTWYVDGVMGVAELPGERAALVQHLAASGTLETWLISGGALPEGLAAHLESSGATPLADAAHRPSPTASHQGHPSRTLAIGGAASAALAVAGFAVASSAYHRFPDATDRTKAESLEGLNHGATIAGGVCAAAGGGLLLGAVISGRW